MKEKIEELVKKYKKEKEELSCFLTKTESENKNAFVQNLIDISNLFDETIKEIRFYSLEKIIEELETILKK